MANKHILKKFNTMNSYGDVTKINVSLLKGVNSKRLTYQVLAKMWRHFTKPSGYIKAKNDLRSPFSHLVS